MFSIEKSIPNNLKGYELFVDFIKKYYEHLSETDEFKELSYIQSYINADGNLIDYIELIKSEFGLNIPHSSDLTNGDLVTKFLAHLQKSRGSEQSIKTFFRLIFNKDILITYPREKMFKTSNTRNITVDVILVKSTELPEGVVYSTNSYISNLNCDVEKHSILKNGNYYYTILEVYNDTGVDFVIGERIDLITSNTTIQSECVGFGQPSLISGGQYYAVGDVVLVDNSVINGEYVVSKVSSGVVESVTVINGGSDYVVGDKIYTVPNNGFYAKVESIGVNGQITSVKVYNKGSGFFSKPTLNIVSENGNSAILDVITSGVGSVVEFKCSTPTILKTGVTYQVFSENGVGINLNIVNKPSYTKRYMLNNNHVLGVNATLIDSDDFHEHSYNIITDVDLLLWDSYFKQYVHRTGYVYKHIFPINVEVDLSQTIVVEHYTNITGEELWVFF